MDLAERMMALPGARILPVRPRILCLGPALKETLRVGLALRGIELGVQLGGGTVAGSYCISDGGDGFLEAVAAMHPARRMEAICTGPLGNLIESSFLFHEDSRTAVIETALACGMGLVPDSRRDIMVSGTAGVGELILTALSYGATRFHIGLGGSATCDGGLGMLAALNAGLVLRRRLTRHVAARDLQTPPAVDISAIRERLSGVEMVVYCDVANPLLGPRGAARSYAPQKGATSQQVEQLELGMEDWAGRVEETLGSPFRDLEGAGAAGGLGFAFAALGKRLRLGAEAFCDLLGLERYLAACDGLITCEGRFDHTSFNGKAPWHAAAAAVRRDAMPIIACGTADPEAVSRAAERGVRIMPFSTDVPVDRRSAEAFSRLQNSVMELIRKGR